MPADGELVRGFEPKVRGMVDVGDEKWGGGSLAGDGSGLEDLGELLGGCSGRKFGELPFGVGGGNCQLGGSGGVVEGVVEVGGQELGEKLNNP